MRVGRVGLGFCVALAGVACQTLFGTEEQDSTASSSFAATSSAQSSTSGGASAATSGGGASGGRGGGGASGGDGGLGGAGGRGAGGGGGSGGGREAPCPADMVLVQAPGWDFCVDRYEVTRQQYQAWLDTMPQLPGPGAKCTWNPSFVPHDTGNSCDPTDYDPGNNPDYPVVCVDWCDARAYCDAIGKRLCGKIGDGAAYPYGEHADAAVSEWYFACSAGGTLAFPYGNAYDPNICYGDDHDGILGNGDLDKPAPVTAKPMCVGGYPDLRHLSGNVWEWENSCEPDPAAPGDENDLCADRGGSFWDSQSWLACDHAPPVTHTRKAFNQNVGIRCCADPLAPPF